MTVCLLFFAELRDRFGLSECEFLFPSGMTVEEAFQYWQMHTGKRIPEEIPVRFAINECYADSSRLLESGDRVAVLTPMSGG